MDFLDDDFEILAKKYLELNKITDFKYINSGCDGSAFDLNDNRVLKITSSFSEIYYSIKLLNKKNTQIADIYKVDFINDYGFIIQEKIDCTSELFKKKRDHFSFIEDVLSNHDLYLYDLNEIIINKYLNKNEDIKIAKEILSAINEYKDKTNLTPQDLWHGNFGLKNKKISLFDQKGFDNDINSLKIKKILSSKYKKNIKLK